MTMHWMDRIRKQLSSRMGTYSHQQVQDLLDAYDAANERADAAEKALRDVLFFKMSSPEADDPFYTIVLSEDVWTAACEAAALDASDALDSMADKLVTYREDLQAAGKSADHLIEMLTDDSEGEG